MLAGSVLERPAIVEPDTLTGDGGGHDHQPPITAQGGAGDYSGDDFWADITAEMMADPAIADAVGLLAVGELTRAVDTDRRRAVIGPLADVVFRNDWSGLFSYPTDHFPPFTTQDIV